MRCLPTLVAVVLAACRAENGDGQGGRDSAPAFGMSSGGLAAYRAGRERELAALRTSPVPTSRALDSLGAMGAGLPVGQYRQFTAAVDDYLKRRSARADDGIGPRTPLDSTVELLDSLRVEWLVLRVRHGQ